VPPTGILRTSSAPPPPPAEFANGFGSSTTTASRRHRRCDPPRTVSLEQAAPSTAKASGKAMAGTRASSLEHTSGSSSPAGVIPPRSVLLLPPPATATASAAQQQQQRARPERKRLQRSREVYETTAAAAAEILTVCDSGKGHFGNHIKVFLLFSESWVMKAEIKENGVQSNLFTVLLCVIRHFTELLTVYTVKIVQLLSKFADFVVGLKCTHRLRFYFKLQTCWLAQHLSPHFVRAQLMYFKFTIKNTNRIKFLTVTVWVCFKKASFKMASKIRLFSI
jgi:hypothetical protein